MKDVEKKEFGDQLGVGRGKKTTTHTTTHKLSIISN